MLSLVDIQFFLANKIFYHPMKKGQAKVLIILVHSVVFLIQRYKYVALIFMLGWVCSRLQLKLKKKIGVPGTSIFIRSVLTFTGEGINTLKTGT